MTDEIKVYGDLEIWSDDPTGWDYRVYTENPERQKELKQMGLREVAVYSYKGKVIAKDYRANTAVVSKLIKSQKEGQKAQ